MGATSRHLRLHAPAMPCAQSECIARFARTFSIGTPRATSPRGCFEGLLRTLNTRPLLFISVQNSWPCLKLNHPRRRFAAPRACNATRPVRVHRSLRSHLLYWNTTCDQSEGLFRGLSSNPYLPEGSKVGPPQSECIAHFTRTFSIGTPHATSPRGCFEGLVRTMNTWPCPKLDLPSPSASLPSFTPSLLELSPRNNPSDWS